MLRRLVCVCESARAGCCQRPGHVRHPGQYAGGHQQPGCDHQLAAVFDRRQRDDALYPAIGVKRGAKPRGRRGSVAHTRHAAIQRPGIPDQPQRHFVRRRRADRRGGIDGVHAQPCQRRFSRRASEFHRRSGTGCGGRQSGPHHGGRGRTRVPDRRRRRQSGRDHGTERRYRARGGQIGARDRKRGARGAGGDHGAGRPHPQLERACVRPRRHLCRPGQE